MKLRVHSGVASDQGDSIVLCSKIGYSGWMPCCIFSEESDITIFLVSSLKLPTSTSEPMYNWALKTSSHISCFCAEENVKNTPRCTPGKEIIVIFH